MNPALAGRCFLLISFGSVMTNYTVDGISGATPLADLAAGNVINVTEMFLGFSNGVIGGSIAALALGGLYLWVIGGITFEIPTAAILSFLAFMGLFGGQGFDPVYLLAQLCGGGIVMGALFMATDPVTSPVTSKGQLLFGAAVGILSGVFRVFGSAADSVSYAIILANMLTPLIDEICVPVPFGNRGQKKEKKAAEKPMEESAKEEKATEAKPVETKAKSVKLGIPKSALILCGITLIAGFCLSGVFGLTKDTIEQQKMEANVASYREVCPEAESFSYDDALSSAVASLGGEVYGTEFGKVYINEMVVGKDASGNVVGYVLSVTSGDGFDGNVTLSVGILADGTLNGISFTELHETAGMGMLCGEEAFMSQFFGVSVDRFTLNKAGGSTADDEIDSVSGASVTSGAVVNAVNAALDFYQVNVQ